MKWNLPTRWIVSALLLTSTVASAQISPGDLVFRQTFEARSADNNADAHAFLQRATFGATNSDIATVRNLGFSRWMDQQMALPPTLHQPRLAAFGTEYGQNERQRVWWDLALNAEDQLRQRMAFALSQILVVSDVNGDLEGQPLALAAYYDLLLQNAFGNYRDLLEQVTLTPVMGHYLSMFRSTRDPVAGIEPDENYAREIMQLFSIGLVELNLDGSVRLDGQNQPIPTYNQGHIVALAEAFTGWNFAGADGGDGDCEPWEWRWPEWNWLAPMEPCIVTRPNQDQPANYHVTSEKIIVGDVLLPAGQTAEQDLQQAVDTLFNHPNVGPFLALRLIQRFVTSNPSPDYVARVASTFNNNGSGVRGDLGAVLKAVLLDNEALDGYQMGIAEYGKLREPLLQFMHFLRTYDAQFNPGFDPNNSWPGAIYRPEGYFGQGALRSPSVFNFFKPDYTPPGAIETQGLVAPEFQVATETQVTTMANLYRSVLMQPVWSPGSYPWETHYRININRLLSMADDATALTDQVIDDLLKGRMDPLARQLVIDGINDIRVQDSDLRVAMALYYVVTSPQSMVQR
ncbi:MAG: DUF1800 family protein [Xanthomonadales bacterium]|nr:DUF1800 family protein [Xanthomonadales bacterium]